MQKTVALFILLFFTFSYSPIHTNEWQSSGYQDSIAHIRNASGVPAVGAVLLLDGKIHFLGVSGIRKWGANVKTSTHDRFQLGSVTKPLTATLTAILVSKGIISLHMTMEQAFPEWKNSMHSAYRKVTIRQLLTHTSGLPYNPRTEPGDEWRNTIPEMKARRREFARIAFLDTPEAKPGTKYVYGGGTIVLAAIMEKITGKLWEELLREHLLLPLGMTSTGFGAMSKKNQITDNYEHSMRNDEIVPVEPERSFSEEVHAPAGRNVYSSLKDVAKWMQLLLPYSQSPYMPYNTDRVNLALRETFKSDPVGSTTPGWFYTTQEWSRGLLLFHYGDNGKSMSALYLAPGLNSGFAVFTNVAGKNGGKAIKALVDYFSSQIDKHFEGKKIPARLENFQKSISRGKKVTASNTYGNMISSYGPAMINDGNETTRWATDADVRQAWMEIDLERSHTITGFFIHEAYCFRISRYKILVRNRTSEEWRIIHNGTQVGYYCQFHVKPVNARYIRWQIDDIDGNLGPTVSEFQVFGRE